MRRCIHARGADFGARLGGEHRPLIIALRDRQESAFREAVHRISPTTDPAIATRAIITMATAVSTWFDPLGPDTADRIAAQYATLALAMVDA